MTDEPNPQSTGTTGTTNGTGTQPDAGSAPKTQNPNEGGLAAALGGKADPKPADPAGDPAPKPTDPAATPPTEYKAWNLPEGYELDAGVAAEATPIFQKLGLNQEQTQELVDLYTKHAVKTAEANQDAFWSMRRMWRDEMKSDEVLGKLVDKQGNFSPESPLVLTVNKALDGLQNPKLTADFRAAMELTGAGDNPAFVRVLYALASKVTEGTTYAQGGPTGRDRQGNPAVNSRPSAAAALYPNLPPQGG